MLRNFSNAGANINVESKHLIKSVLDLEGHFGGALVCQLQRQVVGVFNWNYADLQEYTRKIGQ